MINRLKVTFLFGIFMMLFSASMNAQLKQGELVDGIAAVIGNEIVLESDVNEQMNYAKQQGASNIDKCEFLENLLNNKLLVYEAKKDTLIENRSAAIKEQANAKYSQMLSQFPDEKSMLAAYKFRTAYEMKNAIEKIDTDTYYGQAKYQRITDKADVTPNEVTDFYNMYKMQLPEIKDEVSLGQIMMFPKLTEAHKQELIDKLKKIKQDIQGGETFESQARIYSEDPGSASNGGLMKNISKGQMVKPFEAAALNLQEGEISDPVESEFGYHIIQLVKKSGKMYDARHILLLATPTDEEVATAKKKLDSIRTLILDGKMTFKDAAFKFSDDKRTKFNAGLIPGADGSSKIEKETIPGTISYELAGLNKNDITTAFEDMDERKRKVVKIVKIEDVIPAHQITLETDYDRIKQMALNKKKSEMVEKYVNKQLPTTFISIDGRYDSCNFKGDWKKESIKK
ncbi:MULTISPECIES: peptidylprolyl isomerase [Chryseobacterium]|uniref:Peptidyl-prolyl cis-trans isomerase SurA n=1 Tax=Chryseobacterium camelliae TaxID=1265445 RepID=A0ABU0TE16_9FLAO|nr:MULTISPECIES: peptidylprolyl isomerase [Chryseobacterium]MDT3406886.1 peptidyl-prolyl cis-trans isomerase SurA [Pseudacidovorax intermedius]MDQ1095318.1 peptidyl-prolyl cis-trans isomerase SurA [Chryseobacterium camelliae]MDQ1099257.1 peptidyl-prolyl cis-trans isomerase SurA [Chryseobacterium sp. SORGH_AS_1048]MDR6086606.1 peptidyl-prolyl cis-trans isomerase SurA [Chryseobacterium sp. SORGH_AS_0909]MDR6130976.1 peptidyl-prolyl cis-trans isomerase SurA [Chryseobacterium sp. SORGH_AS_1175]